MNSCRAKEILIYIVSCKNAGLGIRILRFLLWCLSFLYRVCLALRDLYYKVFFLVVKNRIELPVISVGNITTGGTGKTPMIEYLIRYFLERNIKPAVLIRGYGEDEYKDMIRRFPEAIIEVGKDRLSGARKAVKGGAKIILLDDGFQYRKIFKDLEIVLIDSLNPFGTGYLLPRGFLREPVKALRRADFIVITHTEEPQNELKRFLGSVVSCPLASAVHESKALYDKEKQEQEIDLIKNKTVAALSAIGCPESFESSLKSIGANIFKHFTYIDHYNYKLKDLEEIDDYCQTNKVGFLITTSKDWIKISRYAHKLKTKIFVLDIELNFKEGESSLVKLLEETAG